MCHHTAFLPLRLFSCLTDYFRHLSFSLLHNLVSNGSLDSEINTCLLPDVSKKLLLTTVENKPSMLLTLTGNEITWVLFILRNANIIFILYNRSARCSLWATCECSIAKSSHCHCMHLCFIWTQGHLVEQVQEVPLELAESGDNSTDQKLFTDLVD